MIVLGLGFTDHESAAAIVIDGKLSTGIAKERLSRIKKDGKCWGAKRLDLSQAIHYCLDANGLKLQDVDLLAWSHIDHISPSRLASLLAEEQGLDLSSLPALVLPHHFAHACTAFYLSPFSEAAVLITEGSGGPLDGIMRYCEGPERASLEHGDTAVQNLTADQSASAREHDTFYTCDGETWRTLRKIAGNWQGAASAYGSASDLLFGDCLHSGKMMGLAPYGKRYSGSLFLEPVGPENLRAFALVHRPTRTTLEEEISRKRAAASKFDYLDSDATSLAATVQAETEEAVLAYARWLRLYSKSSNLCLAGGFALNCVSNSRIARESGFDSIFVPPMPGDDGIAVGCALYGAAQNGELKRSPWSAFLGRPYSHNAAEFEALGLVPAGESQDLCDSVAELLANGSVVAWYQDGSEMGPRALGHRSFLADPRNAKLRDHLNRVVKGRDLFRPFAPVVLEEHVAEYFEQSWPSHFMSLVASVRAEKRALVPAITHIDGTSRYQVLRKDDHPRMYELVQAFARRTGIPMLLNTSLNRSGEPMVETPMEAARCVIASSVDHLVVDGKLYRRK